ncbi:hypothetical protein V494_08341 [Pseudogymnoascus sp. VKM F-4513 (FW-928)]|nr:hypothetical protein V494_08341 [Pseudogymnoascus sp. VKM F-4513 (FW-928)]
MQSSYTITTSPASQHPIIDKEQPVNSETVCDSTPVKNNEPNREDFSCPEVPWDGSNGLDDTNREMEHEYITGFKLLIVMLAVTLVCFIMMLDMSIIVTAIPQITSDFHSLSDVGWYGSVYLLTNCTLQPLAGKVYSNFNTKYIFLIFLGVFELGSILCGAAQSSNMLIVGRAVAGLGGSGLANGALTVISASVPIHKRPAMMGVMMSVSQLGIVCGPLIGGALTQFASWRWCFYINLPIGGLSLIFLLSIKVPNPRSTDSISTLKMVSQKLDLIGFTLFAPFAIMLLLALEWGGSEYAWGSATVIGLFCGSGGALTVFAAWEYYVGDEAMIPFSMVKKRIVWSSCLVLAFASASMFILTYYLPIYFQAVKGVSPSLSGVYLLPGILPQMVTAYMSGVLVGKTGYYLPWIVTSTILMAIASGLLSTLALDTPTAKWVGYQILIGVGRGSGMQMPIIAIQNVLPAVQIPIGMSLVVFSQTLGGAVFLTVTQLIFNRSLISGLNRFAPTVDPQIVLTAGVTAVRKVVKLDEVPGVLKAFSWAINKDFYLAAGVSVAAFVLSWGMGWQSIKTNKVVGPGA